MGEAWTVIWDANTEVAREQRKEAGLWGSQVKSGLLRNTFWVSTQQRHLYAINKDFLRSLYLLRVYCLLKSSKSIIPLCPASKFWELWPHYFRKTRKWYKAAHLGVGPLLFGSAKPWGTPKSIDSSRQAQVQQESERRVWSWLRMFTRVPEHWSPARVWREWAGADWEDRRDSQTQEAGI